MQNSYLLFIFPICKDKWKKIDNIIKSKNVKIVDVKRLNLTSIGKFNLIKNLYHNEKWLGNENNNFNGLYYKLKSCFNHNDKNVLVYSVISTKTEILILKKQIRDLCGIGNHSIHTTDNKKDFELLSKYYWNDNTIKFLNLIKESKKKNFNSLFKKLKTYIKKNRLNNCNICVIGSSVLSVFNLRECFDIDFLSTETKYKNDDDKIDLSNEYYLNSNFYKKNQLSINEIISNDKYYFYYEGIKFMSLKLIKNFKKLRNEDKDKKDILLIERILNDENYRC